MKNRKFIVVVVLVCVLGMSLGGALFLLFGPKPTIEYIPNYPPKQSYNAPSHSMQSVAPMRRSTPHIIAVPSSRTTHSVSPNGLIVPQVKGVGYLSSSATQRTIGVMPYSGGGTTVALTHTNNNSHDLNGSGAPIMPVTNFLALTQAKKLSQRASSAQPAVAEPAPAPMARMASAPRYAPAPPNTGGGLTPGNDPANGLYQLTEPEEDPIGSVFALLAFIMLYTIYTLNFKKKNA